MYTCTFFKSSVDFVLGTCENEGFNLACFDFNTIRNNESVAKVIFETLYKTGSYTSFLFGEHYWYPLSKRVRSIPEIAALACCRCFMDAYNLQPASMTNSLEFMKLLVEYALPPIIIGVNDVRSTWLSRDLLASDRSLALRCAEKAIDPFTLVPEYLVDEEIVVSFLMGSLTCSNEIYDAISTNFENKTWEFPGGRMGFILSLIARFPLLARSFMSHLTLVEDVLRVIEVCDSNCLPFMMYNRDIWQHVWRDAARRNPYCLEFVEPEEMCMGSDWTWLLPIFRAEPGIFTRTPFKYSRIVAETVLAIDGLLIKNTIWCSVMEVALIAVRCDGRALKYLSTDLTRNRQVALAAVRQTWRAIAWVPFVDDEIRKIAVTQSPEAAMFAFP